VAADVFDPGGRWLRRVEGGVWDGLDSHRVPVPDGIYLLRGSDGATGRVAIQR
jgi:hypothetical protein